MNKELHELRELAKQYAEVVFSEEVRERPENYRKLNSLQMVRPPVLVFEVPWGELDSDELRITSSDPFYKGVERHLRRTLYQLKYFGGDYTVHPYYRVNVRTKEQGHGLQVQENVLNADTGTDILSHEYIDILQTEADVQAMSMPKVEVDWDATNEALSIADDIFQGIMPVGLAGKQLHYNTWDEIPRFHGVTQSLIDIYDRPEFLHLIMEKFTAYHDERSSLYEKLNILETDPYYLHCTPACTYELPVVDMTKQKTLRSQVWGRGMAQIFSTVSSETHYEFDIKYMKRLFDKCGLTYYGCCEPLDSKIDILREFSNLRRISITPWANVHKAADAIQSDFVLSAKSNPAYVAHKTFDEDAVINETKQTLQACLKNNTPCEFILKDISTISNDVTNLTRWVNVVNRTIDKYWL